ncbi:DUF3488 domain-containing transglutaminase family protein [Pontibacterium sp. N1Y112]|uniref:DUF3488 domain-containing transglutaminase family protein n=1 Tax=Pontibacterium sinense TaxID=2781979 RepID=A0A8J7K0B9_9GAMM|nr:DUF3488 and transglutaminase-like domain-containing protein [Pontibacterium sinense]MBE9398849.1 DUF3488 domain-containing transglutaminase family protein [Pontibacterium sinense]
MRQYFGDRSQRLCLGLWFLALLPAIHQLAWVHLLLCLVPIALYHTMRQRPFVRWAMMGTVLFIAIGWIVLNGQPWLSAQTIISVLALVLLLKWAESRTARELRLSAMASLVLATLSSLYLYGLLALAYLVSCGILMLLCLLAINDSEHQLSYRQLLKTTLNLSVLALPVTVLLFVTVPRIQGPLWDIGLAIGLPIELAIDQDARDIGLKATLKAGQVSRLKRSDAPVLVAEFSGAVPYKSRLYWRGPVFSDYDGISWTLPDNWNNRGRLLRHSLRGPDAVLNVLTSKRDRVHYEARVSPHSGRWLYSLDLPSGQTPEAFISGDFQLLGIRKISREFKYDVDAWLEYSGGIPLSAEQRSAYLQYPANSNPKLRAFGQQLAQSSPDPQDILHQWRKTLVTGGYQLTEITDIDSARDNLDTFFFERKTGGIEHLASSTALVLRAAGIPTRLISGYRGGSLIALTNFVVVKQEHAHVWVEIWTDEQGWQRVDAKDFVAPPEPEQRLAQSAAAVKAKPQEEAQTPNSSAASSASQSNPNAKKPADSQTTKDRSSDKGWLSRLNLGFETWMLNYNPDRQIELMKKGGLRHVDWKNLAALAVLGLILLALIYGLLLQIGQQKQDPVRRSFEQLNKQMRKRQLACHAQECPSQWLQRIATSQPPFYPALEQIVGQYMTLRYTTSTELLPKRIQQFQRDVKRLIAML